MAERYSHRERRIVAMTPDDSYASRRKYFLGINAIVYDSCWVCRSTVFLLVSMGLCLCRFVFQYEGLGCFVPSGSQKTVPARNSVLDTPPIFISVPAEMSIFCEAYIKAVDVGGHGMLCTS